MQSSGQGDNWKRLLSFQEKLFDMFLNCKINDNLIDDKIAKSLPWQNLTCEEIPPRHLYSRRIFEFYATYLTRIYKIADAEGNMRHYAKESVLKRLNQSVHRAKKDHGKACAEAELFFTCLNPRGQIEDVHWFRSMKEVITK